MTMMMNMTMSNDKGNLLGILSEKRWEDVFDIYLWYRIIKA